MSDAGMRGVSILGATGSIGVNTLDVIRRHPRELRVVALTAYHNDALLFEQCREFKPELAVLVDPAAAQRLRERLQSAGLTTQVMPGAEGLEAAATHPQARCVMAAIVGAAGLMATLAAARAGKRLLLANKESVVMSGALLMAAVRESGGELIPIDSEHNAIFQCLPAGTCMGTRPKGLRRVILTASGGPFLTHPAERLAAVTPDEACAHPKWSMGRKISVDSATLMNKGLELIEACWLFGLTPDDIEVVVHPQSIVHSMVEYLDGSVLAQLGNPDMRTPIAHALAFPERRESGVAPLDLIRIGQLNFVAPDLVRFPCLALAIRAARTGGGAAIALNAANEVAVQAFLDGRLGFAAIASVIETVLDRLASEPPAVAAYGKLTATVQDIDDILRTDAAARQLAQQAIDALARGSTAAGDRIPAGHLESDASSSAASQGLPLKAAKLEAARRSYS